jgi:hypothetical protein
MRHYTDEFPRDLQEEFEQRIDKIIHSGTKLPIADIVQILFVEWNPEVPIHLESFIGRLGRYIYTPMNPFTIRDSVTAADILFFSIKYALPHLIREEERSYEAA